MTFDFTVGGPVRTSFLTTSVLLVTCSHAFAESNNGSESACPVENVTRKEFVECLCDEAGGIFWETDDEYGCWQLEPGEFDYRCLKGQPLSKCIVTLPASNPPDDEPDQPTIPGAISGGPGGGEIKSVEPAASKPSAPDFELLEQSLASNIFSPFGPPANLDQVNNAAANNKDDSIPANASQAQQPVDPQDNEPSADKFDDPMNESADVNEVEPQEAFNPQEPQASIDSPVAGPCGAGAAGATVMLVLGMSLVGKRSVAVRDQA